MKTLTVEAEVASDGTLQVTVPSGLPPGRVEVVLVIQPKVQNGLVGQNGDAGASDLSLRMPPEHLAEANEQVQYLHLSQEERFSRIAELLEMALSGVSWDEVEEGRITSDRDFQVVNQPQIISVEFLV
jgi:hypothetical protein